MKFVFSIIAILLLPSPALAETAVLPPAPALAAKAYVLYDYTSNQMLAASNTAHEHVNPAALTKLMTAYLAFGAIKQQQFALSLQIHPSLTAVGIPSKETNMFLDHNKAVTVDALLHGLVIHSANDAARALAELISGNERAFARQMNNVAQALGMRDSHFVNATGQPDPKQYSSAYDLALLAIAIVRDFPEYYPMFSLREFKYNNIKLLNNNRLLWNDPFVDGLAGSHADDSGFSLVASSQRGEHRLISVVLGAPSDSQRDRGSQDLLNYGFSNFEIVRLYRNNQTVTSVPVWKGVEHAVDVGFPQGLSVTLPKGARPKFKATMETQQPVVAPIKAGQQLGILKLMLDGKPYAEFPLVALKPVALANVFSRGWDNLRLIFE